MRFSALTGALFAAVVAAGTLSLPAAVQAAIPHAPCQAGGVTPADTAIAKGLRSAMTGKRMGRSVNGYNISCARSIVREVLQRGLPARAAVIAVTTAIAESTLHNYTLAVDHDSLGLFQQRPSTGWGRPEQLTDPAYATNAFLDKLLRLYPANRWMAGEIGQISQRVQVSAFPSAYTPEANDARLIVGQLWTNSGAATSYVPPAPPTESTPTESTPTESAPTESAPAKPAGPFSKALLKTVPGLPAAFDDRHQVMLADWNGDGHADLVVAQQSGTASGATEVRVVSGASNFQHLLLNTAIPMGPTDARHVFSMADWNFDGRFDLVMTQKSGTASGRTEVRVLDGASNLQRYLQESATPLGPTNARHTFSVADWNGDLFLDLVVTQKSGPKSDQTVLRVLDGASDFRKFLLKSSIARVATDERHSLGVVDWNRDGRLDLVVVQKWGMAGGRTEARILAG